MDFKLVDKLLGSTCVLVFLEYLKKGGASFEKGAQEMKTSLKWKVYKVSSRGFLYLFSLNILCFTEMDHFDHTHKYNPLSNYW